MMQETDYKSEEELKKLLCKCHYYKGEENAPFEGIGDDQNKSMLWFYERCWVFEMMGAKEERSGLLGEYLSEYLGKGMGKFRADDSTPITLKALIFNRYMRGSFGGNPEPFKKFYNKYY